MKKKFGKLLAITSALMCSGNVFADVVYPGSRGEYNTTLSAVSSIIIGLIVVAAITALIIIGIKGPKDDNIVKPQDNMVFGAKEEKVEEKKGDE